MRDYPPGPMNRAIRELTKRVRATSGAAVGRQCGVTTQAISLVMTGQRNPGPKILRFLGLEAVTVYRPIRGAGKPKGEG